jgi:hypothetical protein
MSHGCLFQLSLPVSARCKISRRRSLAARLCLATTAFYLILVVALLLMWARSYFVADAWSWVLFRASPPGPRWRQLWIGSFRGRVVIEAFRETNVHNEDVPVNSVGRAIPMVYTHTRQEVLADGREIRTTEFGHRCNFEVVPPESPDDDRGRTIEGGGRNLNYCATAFAPGIAAAIAFGLSRFSRRRERRRLLRGECVRCGYDLRGSLARCPECGLAATFVGNVER